MDIISLLSNKNSPMDKTMNSLKLNVQLFQLLKIAIFLWYSIILLVVTYHSHLPVQGDCTECTSSL